MPRKMMNKVGMPVAIGVFVLIAGIHWRPTLKAMKQTTTFLNWSKSTMGRNVRGV